MPLDVKMINKISTIFMVDIYPYISVNESVEGINGIAAYVNSVTDGLFFPLILMAMFIIIASVTASFGIARAFVFASFFCSILAIFLVVGGMLNPMFMYLLFVMLAGGLMALRLSKSSSAPQI